jgi:hypothetical protein
MPSLHTRAAHRAEQGRYLRSTRDAVVCAYGSWTGEADPLLEAAGGGRPGGQLVEARCCCGVVAICR